MMLSVSGVGLLDGMSIPRDKLIVMITTNNCQHQPRHKITLFTRFVRIKLSSLVKTYQKGIALALCTHKSKMFAIQEILTPLVMGKGVPKLPSKVYI